MSINTLREQLQDIPGAGSLIMSYEDGGKVQVFTIGDRSVRLGPGATAADIRAAFAAKRDFSIPVEDF